MTNQNFPKPNLLVLIVDDDASIRMTAACLLENQGYSIVEADSGEACLSLCKTQKPDIILLDAVMAGMDGFTCCLKIKELFGIQCPPIFMMTALDDRDSVYRSFDVGITDYFVKPLDWSSLPEKIARIALSRAYNKNLRQQFQDISSLKKQISHRVNSNSQEKRESPSFKFNFA